jgi:DNA-binding IclR family transcriptional regulator
MVEELKWIKDIGYAVDEEEDEVGIRCVGSAILNKNGEVEGAISITGPTMRITKDLVNIYGEQVKKCALQISKELGYIPK